MSLKVKSLYIVSFCPIVFQTLLLQIEKKNSITRLHALNFS